MILFQSSGTTVIFIYIYLFLVASGVFAIVASLKRIADPKTPPLQSDSSFQTKWFKWSAPAGLIYGVLIILLVVYLIKSNNSSQLENTIAEQRNEIQQLKQENQSLKSALGASDKDATFVFSVDVSITEALPIFGGKVLITYSHYITSKSVLHFKGALGVSISPNGPFQNNSIEFERGDKFYLRLQDRQVWGVNVVNEATGVKLQFYKS